MELPFARNDWPYCRNRNGADDRPCDFVALPSLDPFRPDPAVQKMGNMYSTGQNT